MSIPISAIVITYNEEKNIQKYIESVLFANEILVIDSFSEDETISLLKKYHKVKLYQRPFDNFTNQKNYAISLAKYDWIIFFDADEIISEDLREEILKEVHKKHNYSAFYVKRRWKFIDKFIKFSGFQNDYVPRVFKRPDCKYDHSHFVHEQLIVNGKSKLLKNKVNHFSYDSYDSFNTKLNKYVKLQADELYIRGVKPNLFHFFIKPLFRFLHHYIFRFGFLDGINGFIIAYIYGFSVVKRYMYLWMKYRDIE